MSGMTLKALENQQASLGVRTLAAVAALLLALGIAGFVGAATGVQLEPVACAAGVGGMLGAIVLGCVMRGRGRAELVVYGVFAAVLVLQCVVLGGMFLGGAAQVANALSVRVGEHTQMYALPYRSGGLADSVLACLVSGGALGLACGLFAQRGYAVPFFVAALGMFAGVVSGWVPLGWWVPVFALGVVVLACARTGFAANALSRLSLPGMLACALVACLIGGGAVALGFRSPTADMSAPNGALERVLWSMRYGDAHFAMPEGKLNGLGPLQAGEQQAMAVTTDKLTFEYLRGFVGERYENGSWLPLASDDVMDNRTMLYWLDQDGFSNATQISDAARLAEYEKGNPATMTQRFMAVRGPYAYLPYAYDQGSAASATTDMAQMRLNDFGEQSYDFDAALTRKAYLVQDKLDGLQAKADTMASDAAASDDEDEAENVRSRLGSLRTYLDDNSAYAEFAKSAYCQVPDNVSDVFRQVYGPPFELTTEQAKIQVLAMLDESLAYSTDAETPNGDQDFVEYVLTDSQSGYSVHYATVATLLLRYYGVPARYVEGYVLNTAKMDAEEAESADKPNEKYVRMPDDDAGGTYTLTEDDAHAWVEYYLDGIGWVPFDVTPEWRDAGYYETTPKAQLVEESQNWSVGEAEQDAAWTPPEDEPEETDEQETQSIFAEMDLPVISWPWVIAGFLLTLLAAFFVRNVLLHARLNRFLSENRTSVDPKEAVPALFSYLVLLVNECSEVQLENQPYAYQAAKLEEAQLCRADRFLQAAQANDRALFGNGEVTREDVQVVASCIRSVQSGLWHTVSAPRRYLQRNAKCLW